jgi:AraC-like DNA-binding protein
MATVNQIESFSPPIFASWCSRNGEICIDRLERYKKLIGPMRFLLTKDEDTETVELVPGDKSLELPSFLVQSEFAFLIGMIRRATHEEIKPVRIQMAEQPRENAFSAFAGITPEQAGTDTITFTRKNLREPFISFNDAMWSYFEPELAKRLADLDVDDSISARVRSALTELLPGGEGTIEDVAEKLGLSRRTLQRKLAEEKTTFQKQLNSTREILAIHYIRNTNMTTNDMAYLLGYAELNSFLRAFTVWTGKSITEYRKEMEAEALA